MAYIKKKNHEAYLITVSCGRDSKGKKISRSITYKPDLFTAKGNPKSESSLEKEVKTFAAEFERKVLTGHFTEGHTMSFEAYSQKYLSEYAELYQAPRTLESTRTAIKQFTSAFGYMTLESLNPLFLQEYVTSLTKQKKKRGKPGQLSPSTIKRKMAVLSAMLSQAVRWNLIDSNPMDRVQIQKLRKKPDPQKIMCFTQEQANIFLAALDNPLYYERSSHSYRKTSGCVVRIPDYQIKKQINLQLKLFFYLAMFTGCRRGELVALTWADIDLQASTIRICKSACRINGQTINKETKTQSSMRTVAVPSIVTDLARRWKHEQALYRFTIGTQWMGNNWVFIRWNGVQMGLDTPYQAFCRIIENYNANRQQDSPELPRIPLHGLRHTAATLLIGHGVDIRTVSNRLGHSNTSTTLNIYSHALEELDRSAADTMAEIFQKVSSK